MDISIKRDGLTLCGRLDKSLEGKCPIAILFHGFGCDLGYQSEDAFQKITDALTQEGIAVIRFDFNGHGKSDGDFGGMNLLNEIEDAIAIVEYVRTLEWVEEIYVVGHSQGGVVAGMISGYYEDIISRLILLAPAASLKLDAQNGQCMMAKYDTNHIPVKINVDGVHEVGGHYFRIAKSLPIFEVTSQFAKETMVIIGAYDQVVSVNEAKKYSQVMKQCSFIVLKHLDHSLFGPDQEEMLKCIVSFLDKGDQGWKH